MTSPWGAADPRRRRATRTASVLTVAVVLVGAVVLGLVDVPGRVNGATPTTNPWLPPDGATLTGEVGGSAEAATVTSAMFAAPQATQSLPTSTGAALIGTLRHELATTVWRRTVATVDRDQYAVHTTGPDIRLLVHTGHAITGFVDGLLLLPHDAAPGAQWQSSGLTIGPNDRQWQASFTAAAGDRPDCLATTGDLTVSGDDEAAGHHQISQTWCRGVGLVQDQWVAPDGSVTSWRATGAPAGATGTVPTTVDTHDTADHGDPSGPADWSVTTLQPQSLGADGPEPMSGSPSGPPLTTAAGLVVVRAGADVVVLEPTESATLQVRHRLHPGGAITAVATFGDVVLTATMTRELLAWDATSAALLWRVPLDDVAAPVVQRLTADAVLVALASGDLLAIDLHSGAELWRAPALVGSDFPASVGIPGPGQPSAVLVAGVGGVVELRDAATGAVRWSWRTDAIIDGVVLGAELAWVATDAGLYGLDLTSGTPQLQRRSGTTVPPLVSGDRVVLVRPEGVRALDRTGQVVWRTPYECRSVQPGLGGVLCWQADRVRLLDVRDGSVISEHPLPAHGNGQLFATVTPSAVWWRISTTDGSSWAVYRWSA